MRLQDLKTVAVIGAGDMGHGIAQVALMAGIRCAFVTSRRSLWSGA